MKLENIGSIDVKFEDSINSRTPNKREITDIIATKGNTAPKQFEHDVINFLFMKKEMLGLEKIYSLKNSLIDCYVETTNKTGISVEFKLALNWNKGNVARSQLLNFKKFKIYSKLNLKPPKFGIIIFGHFSGDWKRVEGKRTIENGWYRFYQEQNGYNDIFKIQILQLKDDNLYNPDIK